MKEQKGSGNNFVSALHLPTSTKCRQIESPKRLKSQVEGRKLRLSERKSKTVPELVEGPSFDYPEREQLIT